MTAPTAGADARVSTAPGAEADARVLTSSPLTAAAFAPFGDVIEVTADAPFRTINDGQARRYHDLARIDVGTDGGRPLVNIFRALPQSWPLRLRLIERHRLGSQAFVPLSARRYLVVVARPGSAPTPSDVRCFLAGPGQGVNYRAGTWHHPLLALDAESDFLVIDRGGPGAAEDCDVMPFVEGAVCVERPSIV